MCKCMGLPEELVKQSMNWAQKCPLQQLQPLVVSRPSAHMCFLAQGKAGVIQRIQLFQQISAGIHAVSNLTTLKQHKECFKHSTTFSDDRDSIAKIV